jgi:hypothetical protein
LLSNTSAYWTALSDVTFKGGTASSAEFYRFQYADVGWVEFLVSDSAGRLGTSLPFVERPERLVLVAPSGNGANSPATTTDPVFVTAATSFTMSVQALLYGGGLAPNFGKETTPITLTLEARAAKDLTGARLSDMVASGDSPEDTLSLTAASAPSTAVSPAAAISVCRCGRAGIDAGAQRRLSGYGQLAVGGY